MPSSSRPEMALVLLLLQAAFWALAAVSALPYALGGEPGMTALAVPTTLLAVAALGLGAGIVARRGWARTVTITLESLCLAGSLLLLVLPVGAPHGPVALLTNLGLPAAVIALLAGRRGRGAFARA